MVIVIIGVAGSGKTVVGEALAARLGWAFHDADDWHSESNIEKMRMGVALSDRDRVPWIRSLSGAIEKWIADKCDVSPLACSALRKRHRAALITGELRHGSVHFVYLRGTYEEIDRRLRNRIGHFMPESLLRSQFAALQEPDPSEAFVADSSRPVSAIVDSIIQGFRLRSTGVTGKVGPLNRSA